MCPRADCWSGCGRAACAAPISTSWTANCPTSDVPLIPGHEIVGVVERVGDGVTDFAVGDRVGIPWLGHTCGECPQCHSGHENLCANARFTGYQIDGGYAEYAVADAGYVFKLPDSYSDVEAAPLLCAGLIGYRAYRMTGDGAPARPVRVRRGGAHRGPGRTPSGARGVRVHVARATRTLKRSREVWARHGRARPTSRRLSRSMRRSSSRRSGRLVPEALSHVVPAGVVVCAGIHMSDIPSFPYRLLWEERTVRSVANLTRQDAREFLALAATVRIKTHIERYDLARRKPRARRSASGPRSRCCRSGSVRVTTEEQRVCGSSRCAGHPVHAARASADCDG